MPAFPVHDGFDLYPSTSGSTNSMDNLWSVSLSNGTNLPYATLAMSSSTRFGTGREVRLAGNSYGGWAYIQKKLPAPISSFAIGVMISPGSLGGSQHFIGLRDSAGTYQIGVFMASGATGGIDIKRLTAQNTGTTIASAPAGTLVAGNEYYFELFGTIHDTTGSITLKVDGIEVATFTGDTRNGLAEIQFVSFGFMSGTSNSSSYTFRIDDFYCRDVAIPYGPSRIEIIYPNADTTDKDFVPSTGTANYAMLDDAYSDVDYVSGSNVGDLDLYDCGNLVGVPATIHSVRASIYGRKTDAGPRSVAIVIDRGGSQVQSANFSLNTTVGIFSDEAREARPGGGAWTPADIAGIKIGQKVTV